MGYQSAAFVLSGVPDWRRLEGVLPTLALSGFEHAETGLALLFARPIAEDEDRYPYLRLLEEPDLDLPPPGADNESLVNAAAVAAGLLSDTSYDTRAVRPALKAALALNKALGRPVLYLAANDEELNLGFLAEQGTITKFAFHGVEGSAELVGGNIFVQPVEYEGEDPWLDCNEIAEELGEVPLLQIKPSITLEDSCRHMHSASMHIWPREWPNPAEVLGLGTWDAWLKFESTFTSVYQRR